jgi:Tol biopolymer transport system component
MLFTKLKVAMVLMVVAGLTRLALVNLALAVEEPAKKNRNAKTGTLLLARRDALVVLTPEGKEETELTAPMNTRLGLEARLSPDGAQVAYVVGDNSPLRPPTRVGEEQSPWPLKAVVQRLGAAKPTAIVNLPAYDLMLTWAPGGKRLLVTKQTSPDDWSFETILLDPITGKDEPVELPAEVRVLDWSRDGQTFLVVRRQDKNYRLGLMAPGDKKMRELTDLKGRQRPTVARLSPDGKKVLYIDADPTNKDAHRWGWSNKVYLLDVATKNQEALADFPSNGIAEGGLAWAPDGKRIAYTWRQVHPELLKKDSLRGNEVKLATEAFLMVADSDGKNAKTIFSGRCDDAMSRILLSLDWR